MRQKTLKYNFLSSSFLLCGVDYSLFHYTIWVAIQYIPHLGIKNWLSNVTSFKWWQVYDEFRGQKGFSNNVVWNSWLSTIAISMYIHTCTSNPPLNPSSWAFNKWFPQSPFTVSKTLFDILIVITNNPLVWPPAKIQIQTKLFSKRKSRIHM